MGEPGVPHIVTQQTRQEGTFSFQAGFDGILRIDSIRIPEQGEKLQSQADVGIKPNTTITAQVAARQELARRPKNQQQRGVIEWSAEQNKIFDPGG